MEAVCQLCNSRFCLVRSPEVCITLHQRRDVAKGIEQPAVAVVVKRPAVKK